MRYLILSLVIVLGAGLFFVFSKTTNFEVMPSQNGTSTDNALTLPSIPEASTSTLSNNLQPITHNKQPDIENQRPLSNPPEVIKAIYITSWVAGIDSRMNELIKMIKGTELNAVVIDIKDYSGYITYDIQNSEVEKYQAKEIRTPRINSLIKKLHDEEIYVIARITVFQDPVLAKARPDLATQSKLTGKTWKDRKGLAWMDPASKEVWSYNISIAKDAASRGFDELNFDYIRFPSDGNMDDLVYPIYDGKNTKSEIIKSFMKHLREQTASNKISADLFGLATINPNDLGIGQIIEDAYQYFDFVCPMVYPSHYASGFLGYKNPALYPYEVIKYSMDSALKRLQNHELGITNNGTTTVSTTPIQDSSFIIHNSKLRPWLQDFDLGADYTAEMVKKEIQAVYDAEAACPEPCEALVRGWMLWDTKNKYQLMTND